MSSRRGLLALAVLVMACAGPRAPARREALPPPAPESRAGIRDPGAGPVLGSPPAQARLPREAAVQRALVTASGLVGAREIVVGGTRYGDGCVALVRAALESAGAPLAPGVPDAAALHSGLRARGLARRGRPSPGDLVFLADRPGGPAEHVGLVESVSAEGTVLVLHHTERGVARLRLNAAQPWKARSESGRALNDVLVVGGGRITAGRLLVAYASLL